LEQQREQLPLREPQQQQPGQPQQQHWFPGLLRLPSSPGPPDGGPLTRTESRSRTGGTKTEGASGVGSWAGRSGEGPGGAAFAPTDLSDQNPT